MSDAAHLHSWRKVFPAEIGEDGFARSEITWPDDCSGSISVQMRTVFILGEPHIEVIILGYTTHELEGGEAVADALDDLIGDE